MIPGDIGASLIVALAVGAGLGALFGYLAARLRAQRVIGEAENERARTEAQLDAERRSHEERVRQLQEAREELSNSFNSLARRALRDNSEEFLQLAQQKLGQFQARAQEQLGEKEKSVENLVKPINEALQKTEKQIQSMEKERKEAYGSISRYLEQMAQTQQQLQAETSRLVQALRRPEVRGQWGEMTLRRLAELAGMVEHCDFYEQEQRSGDEGSIRPDMVVRMPEGREIVVDVKTSLDSYLSALEAVDEDERRRHIQRHAAKVRERVRELAGKAYWSQFRKSPEFVVLFIPGDQFLSAAMDVDSSLMEEALRQRVIIATPTTFVALLRAVAYGWRQLAVAENAEKIRDLGEELYKRLATFADHLNRLGKSLGSSVDHFNRAVGSLERQVLPGARRFPEMGINTPRRIDEPEPLDKATRSLTSASEASDESPGDGGEPSADRDDR